MHMAIDIVLSITIAVEVLIKAMMLGLVVFVNIIIIAQNKLKYKPETNQKVLVKYGRNTSKAKTPYCSCVAQSIFRNSRASYPRTWI